MLSNIEKSSGRVCSATILVILNEKLHHPLSPFQWWRKWRVLVLAGLHRWFEGRGVFIYFSFYCDQDCSTHISLSWLFLLHGTRAVTRLTQTTRKKVKKNKLRKAVYWETIFNWSIQQLKIILISYDLVKSVSILEPKKLNATEHELLSSITKVIRCVKSESVPCKTW